MATLLLALVLILHSSMQGAEAARFLMEERRLSTSATEVPSQTLEKLHEKEKNPYKKEKSSFRRVPPSRSNPTQNK